MKQGKEERGREGEEGERKGKRGEERKGEEGGRERESKPFCVTLYS